MMIEWIATITALAGAFMIATKFTEARFGFISFFISSSLWCVVAYDTGQYALFFMNLIFTFINMYGIYKWSDYEDLSPQVEQKEGAIL